VGGLHEAGWISVVGRVSGGRYVLVVVIEIEILERISINI
jgi:hypothetical protein